MVGTDLQQKEMDVVARVTQAFPDHILKASVVDVRTLEGGKAETLRFTLDDAVSTDLPRPDIASRPAEDLASEVEEELRVQMAR